MKKEPPMGSDSLLDFTDYSVSWTPEQDKRFEIALAMLDEDTPDRWEKIAKAVGDKTVKEVKRHHEILVQDIDDIESGLIPIPNYKKDSNDTTDHEDGIPVLLHTDGFCIGMHGEAGFGVTLHDHDGAWIAGFCGSVGIATIVYAALMAIYEGLNLAWKKGYRTIWCRTNSQEALELILQREESFHLFEIVIEIQYQLDQDWSVKLQLELEKVNVLANYLAMKGAAGSVGLKILDHPLEDLTHHPREDLTQPFQYDDPLEKKLSIISDQKKEKKLSIN